MSLSRSIKKRLNKALEDRLGLRLYSILAHGREDWSDIKKSGCRIETIFDVGANIGQSARKFREAFPKATIYSFEPVQGLFQQLRASVTADSRMHCVQMALGNAPGVSRIYLTDHPTTSSLIKPPNSRGFEEVQVNTIDAFVAEHAIGRIDLLKVDAEGFDLEVLHGADNLLSSLRVSFVLAEVGFHPGDDRHVLFDDVRAFLIERGFHVFGFYDQNLEWSGESRLRFANVCFANEAAFRK